MTRADYRSNREDAISQDSLPWLEAFADEIQAKYSGTLFPRREDLTQKEFEAAVEMHYTDDEEEEPW